MINRRTFLRVTATVVTGTLLLAAYFLWNSNVVTPARPLFRVEGVVFANGEPAPNVHIAFHPVNALKMACCPVGRTDTLGRFVLTTKSVSDGAPVGEYNVTFFWPDPTVEVDKCECPDPLLHDRFRGLYLQPELSGYQATIDRNTNSFRFDLWRPRSEEPAFQDADRRNDAVR